MNFTREPIIETIITPKDGFKLVVTNTKGNGDEYSVDSLEVVSFGEAIFYRSFEKPKAFLLPVSDFEVIEVRETKVALKNVSIDKTIKIAGGKEASKSSDSKKETKEETKKKKTRKKKSTQESASTDTTDDQKKSDKKSEKKSSKKAAAEPVKEVGCPEDLMSSHVKKLIPPPSTLISETISRYKPEDEEGDVIVPEIVQQKEEAAAESAPSSLDPIWMDDIDSKAPKSNELKEEKPSQEPIVLAPPPVVDEPIGETHAEEKLKPNEPSMQPVSDPADDQK